MKRFYFFAVLFCLFFSANQAFAQECKIEFTVYQDSDSDGFGDPLFGGIFNACAIPIGWVFNNSDCDDNNAAIHPGAIELCDRLDNNCDGVVDNGPFQTYYVDADGDGYGNTSGFSSLNCPQPGYVLTPGDCNDGDPSIRPGAAEVCDGKDNDCDGTIDDGCSGGQGFLVNGITYTPCGLGETVIAPFISPQGALTTNLYGGMVLITVSGTGNARGEDISDAFYRFFNGVQEDLYLWKLGITIEGSLSSNTDDEAYRLIVYDVAAATAVTAPYRPALRDDHTYTFIVDLTRLNPAPSGLSQIRVGVTDGTYTDNGGSFTVTIKQLCCPGGSPGTVFYEDSDGDGFGNSQVSKFACDAPPGFVTNNTDCNDGNSAVNPGAAEVCDGIDNDCDGQIDEGVKITFYRDVDGDGYGNPDLSTQACTVPEGYVSNNTDCDDSRPVVNPGAAEICDGLDNDCDGQVDEGVKITFYRDVDGDGYGNTNLSVLACSAPAGFVPAGGDCNDNDPAISPAAVEVCGNKIDDNCNGSVDEQPCYPCINATNFTTTNVSATSATFNWTAIANPAQWQVQYKSTAPGAKWKDVFLTGNIRSVTIPGLQSKQNYIWHIRAKCGKNYTEYSNSIAFTTTAGAVVSQARTAQREIVLANKLMLRVLPNPSVTHFTITVGSSNKKDAIKIFVADMYGRVIEQRTVYGDQTLSLGAQYRPGTYVVKLIQGVQSEQLKLVKLLN